MFNVKLAGGHLYGKQLFTWLSLVVSLMASFVLSFFPLDVLDEIWDLFESVSEGFLTYSKYNVGLKTLLLQGRSEPEFYGDLVYKFRKIIGKNDFPYHFKKMIVRYKQIGYNINVMLQTACLVVNPVKVNSFAYLFDCTTVGRTSD